MINLLPLVLQVPPRISQLYDIFTSGNHHRTRKPRRGLDIEVSPPTGGSGREDMGDKSGDPDNLAHSHRDSS